MLASVMSINKKGSTPDGVTKEGFSLNARYSTILQSSTEERLCSSLRTSNSIVSPETSSDVGPAFSNWPFLMFLF